MTRIKIFARKLTEAEAETVAALAVNAGYLADQIEVITSMDEPDPDSEDDIILLLGTPNTCADNDLEVDLAQVAKGGRRVIWIWPKETDAAALPVAATKYSYSIIPWDSEKLRAVAADDDVMCFESPIGIPLPKVPTERNLCIAEKAKVS